jgi:hypothetical protein
VPQPLTFGLPPLLLFPQRGVLLLGPGQGQRNLPGPAGRAVCAPAATLDTRPKVTTVAPGVKDPLTQYPSR